MNHCDYLPCEGLPPRAYCPPDRRRTTPKPSRSRLSILVADDDAAICTFLVYLLTMAGHTVAIAPEASAAFQFVREERFHLIFLDSGFPESPGLDFPAHLRDCAPEIPVIALDTDPFVKRLLEAMSNGLSRGQTEPFTVAEIQRLLWSTASLAR